MRTTLDLPEDVHSYARRVAHEQRRSMGDVIAELVRAGINAPATAEGGDAAVSPITGIKTVSVGHVVTPEEVRSLEDDE